MIRLAAAALALLAVGTQDSPPSPAPANSVVAAAQLTVRQQIIIRVPRGRDRVPASSTPMHWREGPGLRCIPANRIAGAMPSQRSVDLVMQDSRRVRARLGQGCAALDYYRGLYVAANRDGLICAGRDAIRSRMGGQCDIVQFRLLQPARP